MRIIIPTLKGARIIDSENIIYCKADNNYTEIYISEIDLFDELNYFVSIKLLKDIVILLPEVDFYRTHKSYIINLKYVHEFDKTKYLIILKNGIEIKIAKTKKPEFKRKLLKYIEKFNSVI